MIHNHDAIPADARKMIEAAASRAGMSVGEWLNDVILAAAADEGVKPVCYVFRGPIEKTKPAKDEIAALYSRLDQLAHKIESLAQQNFPPTAPETPVIQNENIGDKHQKVIFDRLSDLLCTPPANNPSLAKAGRRAPAMSRAELFGFGLTTGPAESRPHVKCE